MAHIQQLHPTTEVEPQTQDHHEEAVNRIARGDQVLSGLATTASSAIGRQATNFLHGTWLGHPLHAVLTDVPLGAWTVAIGLDALDAAGRSEFRPGADAAVWLGLAGAAGAAGAASAGLMDWRHSDGEARKTGVVHALLNSGATTCFLSSAIARGLGARGAARWLALAGYGLVTGGGYLGGRLSYDHRLGTDHAERPEPDLQYRAVLDESELQEGQPRCVQFDGLGVVLVRQQGRIYALGEVCAHLSGPLHEGELGKQSISCPWHGSRFSLDDGRVLDGPAVHRQPCYDVRVIEGRIEVRPR